MTNFIAYEVAATKHIWRLDMRPVEDDERQVGHILATDAAQPTTTTTDTNRWAQHHTAFESSTQKNEPKSSRWMHSSQLKTRHASPIGTFPPPPFRKMDAAEIFKNKCASIRAIKNDHHQDRGENKWFRNILRSIRVPQGCAANSINRKRAARDYFTVVAITAKCSHRSVGRDLAHRSLRFQIEICHLSAPLLHASHTNEQPFVDWENKTKPPKKILKIEKVDRLFLCGYWLNQSSPSPWSFDVDRIPLENELAPQPKTD